MEKLITIIDDNQEELLLVEKILKSNGYVVQALENSTRAFNRLKETPPHLVILDLMMPDVSGMDLLKQMREDKVLAHIPVVIFTGFVDDRIISSIQQFDIAGYLLKPIDKRKLLQKVKKTLVICKQVKIFKEFSIDDSSAEICVEGEGVTIGIGETSIVMNSNFSFSDNMTVNMRGNVFDELDIKCNVVKTLKTTPMINGQYKYKNKMSLVALSEQELQKLRSWANRHCSKDRM